VDIQSKPTLESIILTQDKRGMSYLRPFLPSDYCLQAAQLAFDHCGCIFITTGFYITAYGAVETDGPPGAIAIGRALAALGCQVIYITDRYASSMMNHLCQDHAEVIDFPIADDPTSRNFSEKIISQYQPSLLVSVERCGISQDGKYLNCNGADISPFTARIDLLFDSDIPSIGIGDGGNEIGMGNLFEVIRQTSGLPENPTVTHVTSLIAASVSNWGGYGLVAGLSYLAGRDLLPDPENEEHLLQELFAAGCYDGMQAVPTCGVDGYTLHENKQVLDALRRWLSEQS
jgi:hypothetical protein